MTLITTIEQNGEFEKYVDMLADRQVKAQKELKKRERERRRLELGDDYVTSESEKHKSSSEDEGTDSEFDSSDEDIERSQDKMVSPPRFDDEKTNKHEGLRNQRKSFVSSKPRRASSNLETISEEISK